MTLANPDGSFLVTNSERVSKSSKTVRRYRVVFDSAKALPRESLEVRLLAKKDGPQRTGEKRAMGEVGNTAIRMSLRSCTLLLVVVGCVSLSPKVQAQAATEAAGATSVTSYVAASPKPTAIPKGSPANASQSSPHIVASSKAAEVESNRHALETKAGPEAARLLVRSMPSQAQVWINEKPVGTTPLLLIVPAGKYRMELRGVRQESAQQELAVLPKETQEILVKLVERYPIRVVAH